MRRYSGACRGGIPLTFPAGVEGVGSWPVRAGLASFLPSIPPSALGGQLQLLANGPGQTRPGGCGRGAVPPSQDPPESPFLARPGLCVGEQEGRNPPGEG